MEIMTRSEAINKGLSQYYTGMPCKNNHLTYRYTRSGTCASCIRENSGTIDFLQQRQEAKAKRNQVLEHLESMVRYRARVSLQDLAFYCAIVHAAAMEREPGALLADVWKGGTGKAREGDTAVYMFGCFFEDLEPLRATALSLFEQRHSNPQVVAETRARVFAALGAEADKSGEQPQ